MIAAVIDLGFGDSGKGVTVDWLAGQFHSPAKSLVARFSGGSQSEHTVINGVKHVFSQFGSGTLRGVPTYWGPCCTFDPVALLTECQVLEDKGVAVQGHEYYLHKAAPVITPLEILANRLSPTNLSHGTVGAGHGKTLQREADGYSLLAGDLRYEDVWTQKFKLIMSRYCMAGCDEALRVKFIQACQWVSSWARFVELPPTAAADSVIFEGSQGLMLDEDIGFFPHVTRGHTGTKNLEAMGVLGDIEDYYLVTRGYATRHGAGPLPWEQRGGPELNNISEETNKKHEYQGDLRKAHLNIQMLRYAIGRDETLNRLLINQPHRLHLVMTCMDQMREYKLVGQDGLLALDSEEAFVETVSDMLGIEDVYLNRGPEAGRIENFRAVRDPTRA